MLSKSRQHAESGFTLIELMVVVLIIGILVAIALPTFLGARARAADGAAKANLKNAMTAGVSYYVGNGSFTGFDTPGNADLEDSSIDWLYGGAAQRGRVTIDLAEGEYLVLSSASDPARTFCIAISYAAPAVQIRGGIDGDGATATPLLDLRCTVPTW